MAQLHPSKQIPAALQAAAICFMVLIIGLCLLFLAFLHRTNHIDANTSSSLLRQVSTILNSLNYPDPRFGAPAPIPVPAVADHLLKAFPPLSPDPPSTAAQPRTHTHVESQPVITIGFKCEEYEFGKRCHDPQDAAQPTPRPSETADAHRDSDFTAIPSKITSVVLFYSAWGPKLVVNFANGENHVAFGCHGHLEPRKLSTLQIAYRLGGGDVLLMNDAVSDPVPANSTSAPSSTGQRMSCQLAHAPEWIVERPARWRRLHGRHQ